MKTTIIWGSWEAPATEVGLDEPNCNNKKLDRKGEIECDRERNETDKVEERERERGGINRSSEEREIAGERFAKD